MKLIAELRGGDPHKGMYPRFDVAEKTALFDSLGADFISVNTAEPFFGKKEWLKTAKDHTKKKLIRRDFFTEETVRETADLGYDYILLMLELYSFRELDNVAFRAQKLGIIPILDVCSNEALNMATYVDSSYILINNKNERNGKVNMLNFSKLGSQLPDNLVAITSGGYREDTLPKLTSLFRASIFDYILLHDILLHSSQPETIAKWVKEI